MRPHFVPARSTRHRIACFALYRALLRQQARIPLPDELTTALGPVGPIKHLVRRQFRTNRGDTSPRLVTTALEVGYRFLRLFARAADPATPEHASVAEHVRAHVSRARQALERRRSLPPPPSSAPRPGRVPLFTRVMLPPDPRAGRGAPPLVPFYVATERPRPLAALGGGAVSRRRIPRLEDARGVPMLRLTRPQPAELSRVVRQKSDRRQARLSRMQHLADEDAWHARQEDGWDAAVAALGRAERVDVDVAPDELAPGPRFRDDNDGGESGDAAWHTNNYRGTVSSWVRHISRQLTAENEDFAARARAMVQLIEEEKALAEKERAERKRPGNKETEKMTRRQELAPASF